MMRCPWCATQRVLMPRTLLGSCSKTRSSLLILTEQASGVAWYIIHGTCSAISMIPLVDRRGTAFSTAWCTVEVWPFSSMVGLHRALKPFMVSSTSSKWHKSCWHKTSKTPKVGAPLPLHLLNSSYYTNRQVSPSRIGYRAQGLSNACNSPILNLCFVASYRRVTIKLRFWLRK